MNFNLPKFFYYASAYVFIFIVSLFSTVWSSNKFKYGLDMIVRSYDAICWYEALKQFPNTNVAMFKECGGDAKFTLESTFDSDFEWANIDDDIKKFNQTVVSWKNAFEQSPFIKIPKTYSENCNTYLINPLEEYKFVENDALNDDGTDYPYKGFSYCLINQLRQNHGNTAIDAVKNELTRSHKEWHEAFLDRVNEFRALHNSSQFQFVQTLTDSAQQWADKLASECKISFSLDADRMHNGQLCGENLASLWDGLLDDLTTASYLAADSWYEEVKFYPWKTGFRDDDIKKVDWDLFGKIKDFTQMVWRNSQAVGYGYSFNATCAEMGMESRFVVARYFPAGNTLGVKGTFKQNVKPAGLLSGVVGLLGGLLGGGKKNQNGKAQQRSAQHRRYEKDQSNSNGQNGENIENRNGRRERKAHKRNNWGNKNDRNGHTNKNKRWIKNK